MQLPWGCHGRKGRCEEKVKRKGRCEEKVKKPRKGVKKRKCMFVRAKMEKRGKGEKEEWNKIKHNK